MIFKIGSNVKCINKRENETSELVIGDIYKVLFSDTISWIKIVDKNGKELKGVWSMSQFKLIAEEQVFGIVQFCKTNYK